MSTESSTSSSSSDSESGYDSNTGHGNHRGGRGGGGRIHSSSSSASGSDSDYCSGSGSDYGSGSESSSSSDSYSDSGYGSESGQGDDRCRRVGGGCIDSSSNNGTKRSGSSTTGGRGPGNAAGSSCTVGPSGGGGGGDNNAESVYWPGWEVVGDDYTYRILDEGVVEVTLTKDKGVRAGEAKGEGNDKKSAPKRVASSNSSGANGVKHVFGNDFVPCGARFKFSLLTVGCEEKDCSLVSVFAATTTWEGNGGAVQLSIFPGRNAPHLPNGDVFGQGNDPRNSRRRHQQRIFKHLGAVHPEQSKEHARKLLLDPEKSKDLADKDMRIRFNPVTGDPIAPEGSTINKGHPQAAAIARLLLGGQIRVVEMGGGLDEKDTEVTDGATSSDDGATSKKEQKRSGIKKEKGESQYDSNTIFSSTGVVASLSAASLSPSGIKPEGTDDGENGGSASSNDRPANFDPEAMSMFIHVSMGVGQGFPCSVRLNGERSRELKAEVAATPRLGEPVSLEFLSNVLSLFGGDEMFHNLRVLRSAATSTVLSEILLEVLKLLEQAVQQTENWQKEVYSGNPMVCTSAVVEAYGGSNEALKEQASLASEFARMALAEVVSSSEKAEAFKEQFPVLECLLWLFERKRKGSALDENPDEKKKKAEHARKQYLEQEAFIAALRQKADDLIEKRGEERECYDEFCEASSSRNPVLGTVMTLSRNDQPSVEAVLEAAREQHRGTLSSLTTRTSARRSVLEAEVSDAPIPVRIHGSRAEPGGAGRGGSGRGARDSRKTPVDGAGGTGRGATGGEAPAADTTPAASASRATGGGPKTPGDGAENTPPELPRDAEKEARTGGKSAGGRRAAAPGAGPPARTSSRAKRPTTRLAESGLGLRSNNIPSNLGELR